jgi:hypothetical protein
MTDPSGVVTLPFQNVPAVGGQMSLGLLGYLKVTGPSFVPLYRYWGIPLSGSDLFNYGSVFTPSELQGLFAAVNVTLDPSRGVVSVVAKDRQFAPAAGVQVTLSTADALTRGFSRTGAAGTTTDQTGVITFANVPTGIVQMTAMPAGLDKASSSVSATVRAGTLTLVIANPTP